MVKIALEDFRRTRETIRPYIFRTPVVQTDWPRLYLKLENLQRTHSFKIRGAFSRILHLAKTGDKRRILTVSAGNFGQAVAYAASVLNVSCTVVVPESAPKTKIEAISRYPAELLIKGRNFDEAEVQTLKMSEDADKWVFLSPYNDRDVILGYGTLALELIEEQMDINEVLVPIGGGGLAAGVAAAMKQLKPTVRVVGVQAEASAAIYESLKVGKLIKIPDRPSLADGIQGNVEPGSITFDIIKQNIDDVVTVSEEEIIQSIRALLLQEKILAEGAAAVGVAAFCTLKTSKQGSTVAILSGGNIDFEKVLLVAPQCAES